MIKVKTATGVIVLENLPEQAEVFVDGDKVTVTWPEAGGPAKVVVTASRHGVEVKKDGLRVFGDEVVVHAGATKELRIVREVHVDTPTGTNQKKSADLNTADLSIRPSGTEPSSAARRAISPSFIATTLMGKWAIDDDELVQNEIVQRTSTIVFGDPSWSRYDLKFQAMSIGGTQGFGAVFHFKDSRTCCWFNVGSYHNEGHELCTRFDGKRERGPGMYRLGSIQFERWYDIKLEVRESKIRCFSEGEIIFEHKDDRFKEGLIGFNTWNASARFRNIEVTTPEGELIWKGLPVLRTPPSQ